MIFVFDKWWLCCVDVLQARSLVEFFKPKSYTIHVHDLYLEYTKMEVEKKGLQHSARCCFSRGRKRHQIVQEGRVCIHDHLVYHITMDILSCAIYSKAETLRIKGCAIVVDVDVSKMENLRKFHVIGGCPQLARVHGRCYKLKLLFLARIWRKFYPNLTSMESLKYLD